MKNIVSKNIEKAYLYQSSFASSSFDKRRQAILAIAESIVERSNDILSANLLDMQKAQNLSPAKRERLRLDAGRIDGIVKSLQSIAKQDDPLGRIIEELKPKSGLTIQKISAPIGVIGIIFEARPNVVADAASLCILSGNAAILRAGSDSLHSATSIAESVYQGLEKAGLSKDLIYLIPYGDRAFVPQLLTSDKISLMVPRGGKELVKRVISEARMPVIAHHDGICHVYLHASANPRIASDIIVNSKMRRVDICGATETLLIDKSAPTDLVSDIILALHKGQCELRACKLAAKFIKDNLPNVPVIDAGEEDWKTEYLANIISIKIVDGAAEAIDHINKYGSGHTDAIIADDQDAKTAFVKKVKSAIVITNASTQFADGGEFGFGAEIGIATGKMPPRGPVGARELTSYFYHVAGNTDVKNGSKGYVRLT